MYMYVVNNKDPDQTIHALASLELFLFIHVDFLQ